MRYLYRCAALRLCMGLRGIWYPLRLCADCFGAGSLARSPARSPNRTPWGYNVRGHMRCLTPSAPEKSKRPMPGKVSCPVRNCPNQTKFRLPKSRRKNKKKRFSAQGAPNRFEMARQENFWKGLDKYHDICYTDGKNIMIYRKGMTA